MEKLSRSEKIEKGWLHVRAIIEIVGKPKEHVEKTLKDYVKGIRESKDYEVTKESIEKPIEKENYFTTFAELEFWTPGTDKLTAFCFDYMPSSIEIMEPEKRIVNSADMTDLYNDLQARLHHVDMLAKNLHQENKAFNASVNNLVRNIVLIVLAKGPLPKERLGKYTGIKDDKLDPFLKKLEEEGMIEMKDKLYHLKKKEE